MLVLSPEIEVCPVCGGYVHELVEATGFCIECSRGFCYSCGNPFNQDTRFRRVCPSCREEAYYKKYADQLESLLLLGHELSYARVLIAQDNAPRCLSCGDVIKTGRATFCSKRVECRKAKRRYKTLKTKHNGDETIAFINLLLELEMNHHGERVYQTV